VTDWLVVVLLVVVCLLVLLARRDPCPAGARPYVRTQAVHVRTTTPDRLDLCYVEVWLEVEDGGGGWINVARVGPFSFEGITSEFLEGPGLVGMVEGTWGGPSGRRGVQTELPDA
jgi:hypothetical protein